MAVLHISEEEAARTLPDLIAKVRRGESVHIDTASESFALMPVDQRKSWTVSDAIRQADARGSKILLDDDFCADMEEIMRLNRLPREEEPWE